MASMRLLFVTLLLAAGPAIADDALAPTDSPAAEEATKKAEEDPATVTARQIRDGLAGDYSAIHRLVLVANRGKGFGVSKQAKAQVAAIAAALGPEFQVDTHFIQEKSPTDRMFAGMNLSDGATATDANALMKKSGDVPAAVVALDDASFIQSVEALDMIQRKKYRNSLRVLVAIGVSQEVFDRVQRAPVPVRRLPVDPLRAVPVPSPHSGADSAPVAP